MRNLFARLLARNRGFLLACALVLGWFEFLMCARSPSSTWNDYPVARLCRRSCAAPSSR
jgi:hypothetical protein